jgi:hypothetical protein
MIGNPDSLLEQVSAGFGVRLFLINLFLNPKGISFIPLMTIWNGFELLPLFDRTCRV